MLDIQSSVPWIPFDDIPKGWEQIERFGIQGYLHRKKGLYVISAMEVVEGLGSVIARPCHHVSVSSKKKVTWADICYVKNVFMGEEVEAFHVIPRKSKHVNICETCFHIWSWEL